MFLVLKRDQVPHLALGPDENQIESPHICWYACVGCIVTKHPHSTTLGELIIFVIEVFWEEKGANLMRYFISA